jgi:hypothetical protein
MQLCLSALIADFLEVLQWNVVLRGRGQDVDGSPGDLMDLGEIHHAIDMTTHAFRSVRELEAWCAANGVGLLKRSR